MLNATPSRTLPKGLPLSLFLFTFGCSEYNIFAQSYSNDKGYLSEDEAVSAGQSEASTPEEAPTQELGSIHGRVCDPSQNLWLVGADVYVDVDRDGDGTIDDRQETYTDAQGRYSLEGIPVGEHMVHIEKGSFSASVLVDFPGGRYELPEDVCAVDAPEVAVVLGAYDHIEDILDELAVEYDTYNGVLEGGAYLSFLQNPIEMAKYDIIFFNCGVSLGLRPPF